MRVTQRVRAPHHYRIEVQLGEKFYWLFVPTTLEEALMLFDIFYAQNIELYEQEGEDKVHEVMSLWQYYRDHADDPFEVKEQLSLDDEWVQALNRKHHGRLF